MAHRTKSKKEIKSTSTAKSSNKQSRLSPFDMYIDMISNKISRGMKEPKQSIPDGQIRTGLSTIYTKQFIKKVLIVKKLPEYVEEDFNNLIRSLAGPNVDVVLIYSSTPYKPNWNSPHMKRRMRQFARSYDEYNNYEKTKNTKDKLFTTDAERILKQTNERMVHSFEYIQNVFRSTSQLAEMYVSIELSIPYRQDDSMRQFNTYDDAVKILGEAIENIERYANSNQIVFYKPFMNCLDYMKAFYPCSVDYDSIIRSIILPTMIADTSISRFYSLSQGEISGHGVYIGTDVMTKLPVHKEFASSTGAQNIFVLGKTGKGKSFYFKTMLLYFLANKYRVAVVDYEGDEYTNIGKFLGAKTLSFSVNNGNYFDTSEIGDLTGIEEIDKDLYEEAVHATEHIFDLLVGGTNEMSKTQKAIFGDALFEVYSALGVDRNNKLSWKNSKRCSYKLIFKKIEEFYLSNKYNDEYTKPQLNEMYNALRIYFGDTGINKQMFDNRISINEIQDSPFIIFSFGMKGSNSQTTSSCDVALRQSCVAYLVSLYANYNKSVINRPKDKRTVDVGNGFTVIAFEEVQRYWETEGAKSIISDVITGARKRNAIAYLMSNSPMSIVSALSKDGSVNSNEAMAVKDNITSLFIGRLEEETAVAVAEAFSIQDCIPQLRSIARNKKYNHCFLAALDKEEFAIVKAEVKPEIAELPIFKTRDVKKQQEFEDNEDNEVYSIEEAGEVAVRDFTNIKSKISSLKRDSTNSDSGKDSDDGHSSRRRHKRKVVK